MVLSMFITCKKGQWLTKRPVQSELHHLIRVISSDPTASAYCPLTYLMGGFFITGCEDQISNLVVKLMAASTARKLHAFIRYSR